MNASLQRNRVRVGVHFVESKCITEPISRVLTVFGLVCGSCGYAVVSLLPVEGVAPRRRLIQDISVEFNYSSKEVISLSSINPLN